jgi:hypothetical protein
LEIGVRRKQSWKSKIGKRSTPPEARSLTPHYSAGAQPLGSAKTTKIQQRFCISPNHTILLAVIAPWRGLISQDLVFILRQAPLDQCQCDGWSGDFVSSAALARVLGNALHKCYFCSTPTDVHDGLVENVK